MRDRVIGIENEFASMLQFPPGSPGAEYEKDVNGYHLLAAFKRHEVTPIIGFPEARAGNAVGGRVWLPNGGVMYIETSGCHLEYATPECRTVRDVVRFNKAGERLADLLFGSPREEGLPGIVFVKNNVAPEEDGAGNRITYGCHENYLVHGIEAGGDAQGEWKKRLAPLIIFLVTRQIFDGAGFWKNPESDHYVFSQRSLFMENEESSSTTSQRGILNTRREHYTAAGARQYRLHLIVGDANMLEAALFLKIGTTALVLAMIEDNAIPGHLREPHDSLGAMREMVLRGNVLNDACVFFKDAPGISPLETQFRFCEAARKYLAETNFESDRSEDEAYAVLRLWQETLDALHRNDTEWLLGRIDHVTKRHFVETRLRMLKNRGERFSPARIRRDTDIAFHRIGANTIERRCLERWKEKRIVTDEEIRQALLSPPADTRAHIRGSVVQREMLFKNLLVGANWDYLMFKKNQEKKGIPDPFESNPAWLRQMIGW